MSKLSSTVVGVAAAGLVVASPAIAAGLLRQSPTLSATSMPASPVVVPPGNTIVARQSPLLVAGATPVASPPSGTTTDPRQSPLLVVDSPG